MTCQDCIHYKSIGTLCDKYIYPEERNNEPYEHYVINDGSYYDGHWHCHRCGKIVDVGGLCVDCDRMLGFVGKSERMTDKEKVIQLLEDIGIKHNVTSDGIEIATEEVDGCTHNLFIKFYSDYNDSFQKIEVYEA